ncbi:MAG TPA: (d)CMP kinase, partial [Acidimicrobiales bacterium]|nr:(d)CMP kinase [Acidimicrobiales bacterium]
VRAELVRRQRAWVTEHGGGVVEGRDIGSVVFPDARLRVFLTARDDIRARRRAADMGADGPSDVAADLARRDAIDSTRAASPLTVPAGALLVDTSDRGVDEIVDSLLAELSGASS